MIEHSALAGIILARDIHAGLLVKPPGRQPEILSDVASLLKDHPVRDEQ
jgi:hypothetical protein